jgi:hypothetical protein
MLKMRSVLVLQNYACFEQTEGGSVTRTSTRQLSVVVVTLVVPLTAVTQVRCVTIRICLLIAAT